MGIESGRRLPQPTVPFLNKDGTVHLDWYTFLRSLDRELGGSGFNRLLNSPARGGVLLGASAIAGAAGTVTITIDGNDYNLVHE